MDQLRALRNQETITRQGWLWREEEVRSKWCKRWAILTNHRMIFLKAPPQTPVPNDPFPEVKLKSVNVLKHGTEQGRGRKENTFIMVDDQGREIVLAACVDDTHTSPNTESIFDEYGSRAEWWEALKELIAKAKLRFVLIKQEGRTLLKDAAQKNMNCIQAVNQIVQRAAAEVTQGGFQQQADILSKRYRALVEELGPVVELDGNRAERVQEIFTSIAEGTNAVVGMCPNRTVQERIVEDLQETGKSVAAILARSVDAHVNSSSKEAIHQKKIELCTAVNEATSHLEEYGRFLRSMDEAVATVASGDLASPNITVAYGDEVALNSKGTEELLGSSHGRAKEEVVSVLAEEETRDHTRRIREQRSGRRLQEDLEDLEESAKAISAALATTAKCEEPQQIAEYARKLGQLVMQLNDATSIVTSSQGLDVNDPYCTAGIGHLKEHTQHNLRAILSSAKGFSAATTGLMEMLKHLPYQRDDEAAQQRVGIASQSADRALAAFVDACVNLRMDPAIAETQDISMPVPSHGVISGDTDSLTALESAHNSLASVLAKLRDAARTTPAQHSDDTSPTAQSITEQATTMVKASMSLNKKSLASDKNFLTADHSWAVGMTSSAQGVADAAELLASVTAKESKPEEMVAAGRCMRAAVARLVTVSAIKFDATSAEMQEMDSSMQAIVRLVNGLVHRAKAGTTEVVKAAEAEGRLDQIRLEFEAQANIARLENELDQARAHLHRLRRSAYVTKLTVARSTSASRTLMGATAATSAAKAA